MVMAYEFRFPDVGQGITEGTIVKWLVKEGDRVKEDQALGEIETDKALVEMPSPKAGLILKMNPAKEGDKIKVGDVIAVIGEKGEKALEAKASAKKPVKEEKGAAVVGFIPETMEELEKPFPGGGKVLATLGVRKLAKELGVDMEKIGGTGPEGRIMEKDVRNATGSSATAAKPAPQAPEKKEGKPQGVKMKHDMWGFFDRAPVKGIRKAIAEKMMQATQKAALLTHMQEADATTLASVRERMKKEAEKNGVHLTYLPFILRATVEALKKNPYLNSSLDEDNQDILLKQYYSIGVATDTENGLMVPVVKRADMKSLMDIAKETNELTEKARSRKIDLMDLKGGSFTITNLGSLGGRFFTPIINYPEAAILGIGRIYEKAVAENGKIAAKKVLPLSLTYDHRIIDGAQAAKFLHDLTELLNDQKFLEGKN